jgi:TetR/AcrR family transcriptional regulator
MPIPPADVLAGTRRCDSETTRSAILDAAESVFVERGFAATAMTEIASRAGVTKSLIHHHFGSKDALWQEVKHRRLQDYAEMQLRNMSGDPDPDQFADSIRRHFHFLQDNPEWVRLSSWINMEEQRSSEAAAPELMGAGLERVREAQRSGSLRSDLDPENVLAAFLAMCSQWFLTRQSYEHSQDADPKATDERYLEDIIKIFFEGIRPR